MSSERGKEKSLTMSDKHQHQLPCSLTSIYLVPIASRASDLKKKNERAWSLCIRNLESSDRLHEMEENPGHRWRHSPVYTDSWGDRQEILQEQSREGDSWPRPGMVVCHGVSQRRLICSYRQIASPGLCCCPCWSLNNTGESITQPMSLPRARAKSWEMLES